MDMTTNRLLFAFGLTLFAGLSTGIGSALDFYCHTSRTTTLSHLFGIVSF